MKYKESSLSELAEIISLETGNEISKSGLNHRFRKIRQIIEQIEKKWHFFIKNAWHLQKNGLHLNCLIDKHTKQSIKKYI